MNRFNDLHFSSSGKVSPRCLKVAPRTLGAFLIASHYASLQCRSHWGPYARQRSRSAPARQEAREEDKKLLRDLICTQITEQDSLLPWGRPARCWSRKSTRFLLRALYANDMVGRKGWTQSKCECLKMDHGFFGWGSSNIELDVIIASGMWGVISVLSLVKTRSVKLRHAMLLFITWQSKQASFFFKLCAAITTRHLNLMEQVTCPRNLLKLNVGN